MAVVRSKKTVSSKRRYKYSSFKARLDELKIEPAKNLEKRVHDHVESSHLLASFQHWTDVNLSGNFQRFSGEIQDSIQTLPQILYHENRIFNTLVEYIDKHDALSLEPLLDLMAQFVHDLGPDFKKFYERAIKCLINLLENAINFETTKSLESGFNCLAYIFKYMSRILSADLQPTIKLLFPLLSHRKEYLSRFSAEALSFLVRKQNARNLGQSIDYFFSTITAQSDQDILEDSSFSYYEGVLILFTESIISTTDSLHSRANVILGLLLERGMSSNASNYACNLCCDIWLNISRHASESNMKAVYEYVLHEILMAKLDDLDKNYVIQFLLTSAFAESGSKVSSWDDIIAIFKNILKDSGKDELDPELVSLFLSTALRNMDVKNLTQYHRVIFDLFASRFPNNFIEFFNFTLNLTKDKLHSYSVMKIMQKFLNNNLQSFPNEKLALFLLENLENSCVTINYPERLRESTLQYFSDNMCHLENSDTRSYEVYWRSIGLSLKNVEESKILVSVLESVFNSSQPPSRLAKDMCGSLIECLTSLEYSPMHKELVRLVFNNINTYQNSFRFMRGVNKLLSCAKLEDVSNLYYEFENNITKVADNLITPNQKLRNESLIFFTRVYSLRQLEVPSLLRELITIEQTPLTIENARNITVRVRGLKKLVLEITKQDLLLSDIFFRTLFGFLTVRFSPLWDGIFEIMPSIYTKRHALVWQLILHFLNVLDTDTENPYCNIPVDFDSTDPIWFSKVQRLNDVYRVMHLNWSKYQNYGSSLITCSEELGGNYQFPSQLRTQTLKLMSTIPSIVENNFADIENLFFNRLDLMTEEASENGQIDTMPKITAQTWRESERKALLKIMGSFKNAQKLSNSKQILERLIELLGSKTTEIQKLALNAIVCFKIPVVAKYLDNLRNLLDDTLFKDEITKFIDNNDEGSIIQKTDEHSLMPYVLRIFFGRAQTPATSNLKKGKKTAVITILPNFHEKYIIDFLHLASNGFGHQQFFAPGRPVKDEDMKSRGLSRISGFIHVVSTALPVLGSNYPRAAMTIVRPLIYSALVGSQILEREHGELYMRKKAINVRQQSLRCLNILFQNYSDDIIWNDYLEEIFDCVILPRVNNFEHENLEQPSAILSMMVFWSTNVSLYPFLYFKNHTSIRCLMNTLVHPHVKEPVASLLLKACNNILSAQDSASEYLELQTIVSTATLSVLPTLFSRLGNDESLNEAIELLLKMAKLGFVEDNETRKYLIDSLMSILVKTKKSSHSKHMIKILELLALLIAESECTWLEIKDLFVAASEFYRTFATRQLRESLNLVFGSIGAKYDNVKKSVILLMELNSYSSSHMNDFDFPRILKAFKFFLEDGFMEYSDIEWVPLLNTFVYYVSNKDELSLRTNASHAICRFIDFINKQPSISDAYSMVNVLRTDIIPRLREGLRAKDEEIRNEYISILAYLVDKSVYYEDLADMKCLLYNADEEANFFLNVGHIQIHRRQRAIQRLREHAVVLSDNSISHYLIPLIEQYCFESDEKYRNLGNETLITIGILSSYMSWNQYKALFRRYVGLLKTKEDHLKTCVQLLTQISSSLSSSMLDVREKGVSSHIKRLPNNLRDVENFIIADVCPSLIKILTVRNEETIVARIPLAEVLVNLLLGFENEKSESLLPGVLSSICQVLRSKSEELREAVRTSLSKISIKLGPHFLIFIIKELKSSLHRGAQVHVLSYTVHYILQAMKETLVHSDLDGSAEIIMGIIMEDIFGSAGQEKDSENYRTTMKEVKQNKSYDTAEIIAANVSLPVYGALLHPVNSLLLERINSKTQNKITELLRRYALGLNHNTESSAPQVLSLIHEIMSKSMDQQNMKSANKSPEISDKEDFFLVKLNLKSERVQMEYRLLQEVMQKFSLDLLRTVLHKHREFLEVKYLDGFLIMLKETLNSNNESVAISSLKVIILCIKLDLKDDSIFKNCARRVLNNIKDSLSTSSELCQTGLKYLSSFLRHKDVKLKESALSFVLNRVLPDLNEPNKQGLAFNFLKSLVSKHFMLPEIYDAMDTVRNIMITNHAKEIRDVSRSVYYQFLMEYDQSKGRLEKQFKFMLDNLEYPTSEGRQSIMELLNLIITKATPALLSRLSASFFVSLAGVSINDDNSRCKEMAGLLLSNIIKRSGNIELDTMKNYMISWLKQADNPVFLNLGLRTYKIYLSSTESYDNPENIDETAISRIKAILSETDKEGIHQWDLVYTSLNAFSVVSEKFDVVKSAKMKPLWLSAVDCLLYPHMWVRQIAARVSLRLLDISSELETPLIHEEYVTIANRLLRQLGAPNLTEGLSSVSLKSLVKIAMYWNENRITIEKKDRNGELSQIDGFTYIINKATGIIRSEENPNESFISKKSAIQLLGLLMQLMEAEKLRNVAETIVLALYRFCENTETKSLNEEEQALMTLAQESLRILESKLSVSDFTIAYANVKMQVNDRRQARKAKRSVLAITEPELAAQKKMRKHYRSREKRKHEKDDSGYYQRRNKKRRV